MVSDRYEDKDTHLIPNRNRSPQPIFRHRHSLPGILPRHFSSVRAPSPFSGRLRPSHSLAPALSRGRTHLPPATTTSSAAPPEVTHPAASRHRTPPQQPPVALGSRAGRSLPARRPAVPARPAGRVPADETTSDENTRQRKPNDNSRQKVPATTPDSDKIHNPAMPRPAQRVAPNRKKAGRSSWRDRPAQCTIP